MAMYKCCVEVETNLELIILHRILAPFAIYTM